MNTYLDYDFRMEKLIKLREALEENEARILEALERDMNKPEYEAYTSEIGLLYRELDHTIKNLKAWMKDERVASPMYIQPARSYIRPVPRGNVFIISPWNYPFLLTFSPLIGAIAAGNRVLVKPSNKSWHSSQVIGEIIKNNFDRNYIDVLLGPGGQVVSPAIEENNFDHIFFTGSERVGRKIYQQAARKFITVSLELGGKSPSIVDASADLDEAVRKITWGKFFNSGQTCIAPDYLIIKEGLEDRFIERMIGQIQSFYGEEPYQSQDLARIIDEKNFNRLETLIKGEKIVYTGEHRRRELFFHPSIVKADLDSEIMKEEIFGPILPVLTYSKLEDILRIIDRNPNPLALYLFSKEDYLKDYIFKEVGFGGGCYNDVISHMININLPFGGIASSGIGSYHSYYSFREFSHFKSIVESKTKIDIDLKYPPYNKKNLNLSKKFLK